VAYDTPPLFQVTKLRASLAAERVARKHISSLEDEKADLKRELDKASAEVSQLRQVIEALDRDRDHMQGEVRSFAFLLLLPLLDTLLSCHLLGWVIDAAASHQGRLPRQGMRWCAFLAVFSLRLPS
jgi:hypothetical protein